MNFPLQSYQGAGPLRLGATRPEVEALMGPPDRVSRRGGGLRLAWRGEVSVKLSASAPGEEPEVVEIGFTRHCPGVQWQGDDIFLGSPTIWSHRLIAQDGSALLGFGMVLLLRLGLTLTGFHDGPEEDRAITLFRFGLWDDSLDGMLPYAHASASKAPDA